MTTKVMLQMTININVEEKLYWLPTGNIRSQRVGGNLDVVKK